MRTHVLAAVVCATLQGAGYSSIDNTVPAALQPGTPEGVYRLSGIDSVNLYNGQVSMSIPLLPVGGRGEAGYTITANITRPPWDLEVNPTVFNAGQPGASVTYSTAANSSWWTALSAGYTAGVLAIRQFGDLPVTCNYTIAGTPIFSGFTRTWSHLVFVDPNGTETALYSTSNPHPSSVPCNDENQVNRGKRFAARDGSGMVFISTLNVPDRVPYLTGGGPVTTSSGISGKLFLKNGVRYDIVDGEVRSIVDRNGNTVTIGPQVGNQRTVTDPLGRTVTIVIGTPGVSCDTVTYKGRLGLNRVISVCRRALGSAGTIRPTHATEPTHVRNQHDVTKKLFPEISADAPKQFVGQFGINVINSITFPNAQGYSFNYNIYGEVTRAVLPTGGAIEFDYRAGLQPLGVGVYESGQVLDKYEATLPGSVPFAPSWTPFIYRRASERRTYLNGGSRFNNSTVESTTTYANPETVTSHGTSDIGIYFGGTYTMVANGLQVTNARITEHRFFSTNAYAPLNVSVGGPANNLRPLPPGSTPPMGPGNPFEGREYWTKQGSVMLMESVFGLVGDGSAQPCLETQTYLEGGQLSAKQLLYDRTAGFAPVAADKQFANLTDVLEFAYVAPPTGGGTTLAGTLPEGRTCPESPGTGWARRTHTEMKLDGYNAVNDDLAVYSPSLRALPESESLYNISGTEVKRTTFVYDTYGGANPFTFTELPGALHNTLATNEPRRGNPTSTSQLNKNLANSGDPGVLVTTFAAYDSAGNMLKQRDANGNDTTYEFSASSYHGLMTKVTLPKAQMVDAFTHHRTIGYDFHLGKPTSIIDQNGAQTTLTYANADRLTEIRRGTLRKQFVYDDTPNFASVEERGDQYAFNDARKLLRTTYDSFGRKKSEVVNNSFGRSVTYDGLGRVKTESAPGGSLTTYQYDALSRVTSIRLPDGSTTSISYSGSQRTVTDAAGVTTTHVKDPFGRLNLVVEGAGSAGYQTYYTYDALDQLTQVNKGGQLRWFTYDSLGRLLSANNPETGTVTYAYDPNGNLRSKADARGKMICYGYQTAGNNCTGVGYDGLNRPLRKTYNDPAMPDVEYCYDGRQFTGGSCSGVAPGQVGRLTVAATHFSGALQTSLTRTYDSSGRVTMSTSNVAGDAGGRQFTYSYYADDTLAGITYPSQNRVVTCYDEAGRAIWVSSSATEAACQGQQAPGAAWARVTAFSANGQARVTQLGNNRYQVDCFNGNNRPFIRRVGANTGIPGECNGFVTGDQLYLQRNHPWQADNGTPSAVDTMFTAPEGTVTFRSWHGVDFANRLTAHEEYVNGPLASGGTGHHMYSYDPQGNRATYFAWGGTPSVDIPTSLGQYNSSNNRLERSLAAGGLDILYDNAGHMTYHPQLGTMDYDSEGMVRQSVRGGVTTTYLYDAEGRRVRKTSGGVSRFYTYDAFGQLAAEYSTQLVGGGATQYLIKDHLGSTRMILDEAGECRERIDYYPFGTRIPATAATGRTSACYSENTSQNLLLFTGKERDAETGLDPSKFRYLSSAQGRWISPDLFGGIRSAPQTLNRYAYVRNNPLIYVDPLGLADTPVTCPAGEQIGQCTPGTQNCTFTAPTSSCTTPLPATAPQTVDIPTAVSPTSSAGGGSAQVGGSTGTGAPDVEAGYMAQQLFQGNRHVWQRTHTIVQATAIATAAVVALPVAATGANAAVGLSARSLGYAYGMTGGTGVVLGRYPDYIDAARSINANVFNYPSKIYGFFDAFGHAWTANQAFLDASIRRGQQFYLSNPAVGQWGSYYELELQYLAARGIGANQMMMVPLPF